MITDKIKISKFISLVLRHKPETIDLELDENGWADTDFLIQRMLNANYSIDIEILKDIVKSSDKQRFKFNEDFTKIMNDRINVYNYHCINKGSNEYEVNKIIGKQIIKHLKKFFNKKKKNKTVRNKKIKNYKLNKTQRKY